MSTNKPIVTRVNAARYFVASCNYNTDKPVTWKKTVYAKHRDFALKDDGIQIKTKDETGRSCHYKFSKDDEGKYVKIYAFIDKYDNICQTAMFYVDPQMNTDIRVKSVKADNSEAIVGDIIKLTVEYHRNQKPVKENENALIAVKDKVKWKVKIDGETDDLIVDDEVMRGGKISFQVPKDWKEKEVLLMPYLYIYDETVSQKIKIKKVNNCSCSGIHPLKIKELGNIESYTGDFPSPFQIMNYIPSSKEEPLFHQVFVPDKTIRKWIKDAAEYHEIPHEMIAVILQQENSPSASKFRQFLQFGERTLTTTASQLDEKLLRLDKELMYSHSITKWIYDKAIEGSSGFMNMRRPTLKDTIKYTKEKYCRELMPANVANRIGYIFDSNVDNGIQGDDWRADLYYGAAHIRQLIDRVMGNVCSTGELTLNQVQQVFHYYNGAEKYGKDAITLLKNAAEGKQILYFYEK